MTKKEKAIEIIKQHGGCTGVRCSHEEENECPCYKVCGTIDENNEAACRMFLFGRKEPDAHEPDIRKPPAEKTLLDEFAMAAMAAIISKSEHSISTTFEAMKKINQTCGGAYEYAAAMMREKMRRDETGNVKEAIE